MRRTRSAPPTGAAFLLAQLGAHAAQRFAKRIAPLGILPPHAGILHAIASGSIRNQRELARHLGVQPSRLVLLLDELSDKGLVERQRSASDRRNYELALTRKPPASHSRRTSGGTFAPVINSTMSWPA
jgi:DNA-binding HxlR family transcriptional regulator